MRLGREPKGIYEARKISSYKIRNLEADVRCFGNSKSSERLNKVKVAGKGLRLFSLRAPSINSKVTLQS